MVTECNISETIQNSISTIYGEILEYGEHGKYVFAIVKRRNTSSYPNHPFSIIGIVKTPKARYSKYKVNFSYVQSTLGLAKTSFDAKLKQLQKIADDKKKRTEEKKRINASVNASDFYQIGDIVYNSWGYEQTNVEFFQVVRMTAKRIFVEEVAQEQVPETMQEHGMSCEVVPKKDCFLKKGGRFQLTVKVFKPGEHYLTGGESFYSFGKWDGRPKYCSWYA